MKGHASPSNPISTFEQRLDLVAEYATFAGSSTAQDTAPLLAFSVMLPPQWRCLVSFLQTRADEEGDHKSARKLCRIFRDLSNSVLEEHRGGNLLYDHELEALATELKFLLGHSDSLSDALATLERQYELTTSSSTSSRDISDILALAKRTLPEKMYETLAVLSNRPLSGGDRTFRDAADFYSVVSYCVQLEKEKKTSELIREQLYQLLSPASTSSGPTEVLRSLQQTFANILQDMAREGADVGNIETSPVDPVDHLLLAKEHLADTVYEELTKIGDRPIFDRGCLWRDDDYFIQLTNLCESLSFVDNVRGRAEDVSRGLAKEIVMVLTEAAGTSSNPKDLFEKVRDQFI